MAGKGVSYIIPVDHTHCRHKGVYSLPWELQAWSISDMVDKIDRSKVKRTHLLPVKSLSSVNLQNSRQLGNQQPVMVS
jgi:hypothetical protein